MKKYFYTLTIIALLLTACDKHPETRQIDWSGKERGTLTSAPMKFDTAALLRVTKSVLHGDLLFVEQETIPDNLWSLFRISGDSLHWQGVVLQKGKGTFEISQERAFILAPGNDSLVINPTGYAKNYLRYPRTTRRPSWIKNNGASMLTRRISATWTLWPRLPTEALSP